jgi:hypothetical protein
MEDKSITLRVMVAASSIDVSLLDHIIIGESYYSMADEGLIKRYRSVSGFNAKIGGNQG